MKFPIRHVIFEVTQECNLLCLYCYNHWRRNGGCIRRISFKETKNTLVKLLNNVEFEHITFTGGEPFLADGLKELVLKCRMHGKGVTIISNGTTGQYKDYRMLKNFGVSLFELPLHAKSAELHDRLTGVAGSFRKVIESIKNLSELNAEICIAVVLTKLNIGQFQQTLEFAEQLGIKRLMIARFNIGGRGIENVAKLLPSISELRDAFRVADNFATKSKMRISANVCIPQCIINQNDYSFIPVSRCGSDMLKRPITIDAFGDIRVCNHSPQIIGNIYSHSFHSIFSSNYVKSWEESCPQYCEGCAQWSDCRGGCRAAAEQIGKTINNEDPIISLLTGNKKIEIVESII